MSRLVAQPMSRRFLLRCCRRSNVSSLVLPYNHPSYQQQVSLVRLFSSTSDSSSAFGTPLNVTEDVSTHEAPKETSAAATEKTADTPTTTTTTTLEFKAETLKLLRIVTHSLYTDKEVFVRELVSNASDSLEKLRFLQATGKAENLLDPSTLLNIKVSCDPKNNTVTIVDTGIGMTKNELIENLGTIAKSGSLDFLQDSKMDAKDQADAIIGQFGVGFYSSFVVADRVEVFTRSYQANESGWHWESDGLGQYTVTEYPNLPRGTKIICHLKEEAKEFSESSKLKTTAEKFSSFLSYPIYLSKADGTEELVTAQEALWLKTNATEEEHKSFFRHLTGQSWASPYYTIEYKTDAPLSIKALLYVPEETPSRLFNQKEESGVSLHSRRVLVSKTPNTLIPRWMNFVKGVVDCEDMPMNISRESMQDTKLMEKLSFTIVRRFLKFLSDQSKADFDKFRKFYIKYSQYLKEGFLEDLQKGGKHKEALISLLRFESSEFKHNAFTSIDDYINRLHPQQNNIYYFCASSKETALASPYMEQFKSRGIEVLLLLEDIDEFVAMHLGEYKGKKLVSIDSSDEDSIRKDLDLIKSNEELSTDTSERVPLAENDKDALVVYLKSIYGKKVVDIKYSNRLKNSAAVVSGFLPSSLRRMMKATMKETEDSGGMSDLPATLELNASHPIVTSLFHLKNKSPEVAELVAHQLYDNACIAAGILDEPRNMLTRLNKLLEITSSYAYHYEDHADNKTLEPTMETPTTMETTMETPTTTTTTMETPTEPIVEHLQEEPILKKASV